MNNRNNVGEAQGVGYKAVRNTNERQGGDQKNRNKEETKRKGKRVGDNDTAEGRYNVSYTQSFNKYTVQKRKSSDPTVKGSIIIINRDTEYSYSKEEELKTSPIEEGIHHGQGVDKDTI